MDNIILEISSDIWIKRHDMLDKQKLNMSDIESVNKFVIDNIEYLKTNNLIIDSYELQDLVVTLNNECIEDDSLFCIVSQEFFNKHKSYFTVLDV